MDKKMEFKAFIKKHPELSEYVLNGDTTYQKLYETYDIYGESSEVWDKYQGKSSSRIDFNKIKDTLDNMDVSKIEGHIDNAKKALGIIGTLAGNKATQATTNINNIPKPHDIEKIFED